MTYPQLIPARRPAPRRARIAGAAGSVALALGLCSGVAGQTILGSMSAYAIMAGSTLTNNGASTIHGDIGAAGFAGSGSDALTGVQVSPITASNQNDFTRAFNGLAAMTPTADLSGLILGSSAGATTLAPGIYHFSSTAQLTGNLVLDAQNQPNAVWVFQIGSAFTTAASSTVTFTNLVSASLTSDGLFWQVGTTTTLGAGTSFEGNLLGGTTFDLGTAATVNHGRALTGTGTITLAGNSVDFVGANSGYAGGLAFDGSGSSISAVPEPAATAFLAGLGSLVGVMALRRWRRQGSRRRVGP